MRRMLILTVWAISAAMVPVAAQAQPKDIVDTAVGAGSFNTLVAAVKAAGLVDTLKSPGPFTVFAPTDEAFSKVPKQTLADLLKPENQKQLQAILTYHVVPGKIMAGDVLKVSAAKSVQGEDVSFSLSINNAKVVTTDIECTNGVIHVIDSVIMPPSLQPASTSVATTHTVMPQAAPQSPRQMIESAIATGSSMYNQGHAGQCANLYATTMTQLVQHHQVTAMPNLHRELVQVLGQANATHSHDSRAWMLRRGLDSAYNRMVYQQR